MTKIQLIEGRDMRARNGEKWTDVHAQDHYWSATDQDGLWCRFDAGGLFYKGSLNCQHDLIAFWDEPATAAPDALAAAQALLQEALEVLKPFADDYEPTELNDDVAWDINFTVGDFRRAAAVTAKIEKELKP